MSQWETQLRKGLVELAVLATIARGETYGYRIVEQLQKLEGLQFTESTVYPVLMRLARALRGNPRRALAGRPGTAVLSAHNQRPAAAWPDGGELEERGDFPFRIAQLRSRRSVNMAVIDSIHISESLQTLIDCRLDTIDRMLLGRMPRSERVEIVREVESQIYELLGNQNSDELTREDVLGVLARLDPPEAYLPDEPSSGPPPRRSAAIGVPRQPSRERDPGAGKASGILGIIMLALLLVLYPLVVMLSTFGWPNAPILAVWFTVVLIVFVGSIIGLVLAGKARVKGGWAVAGLVIGIIALSLSVVAGVLGL